MSTHPYDIWPLHVKLFTKEAAKNWQAIAKTVDNTLPLPPGFTCSVELEGVDGKSADPGSGRKGPILVTDGESMFMCGFKLKLTWTCLLQEIFAAQHLSKHTSLLSQNPIRKCAICAESIDMSTAVSIFIRRNGLLWN